MISWNEHYGKLTDELEEYKVIDCEKCKFKHIIPIPSEKELEEYYKINYYDDEKPEYFEKQKSAVSWWNFVYKESFTLFEKFLDSSQRKLIDIGCGPGFFLKFGKTRGWDVLGIEPSPKAAAFAQEQKLNVINDNLTKKTLGKIGKFDVVHMLGVMEHLRDPQKAIELCDEILEPRGILFIRVANDYNPLQNLLRASHEFKPWWLTPPQHINYFDVDTITNLGVSMGFEPISITTTFPMELFLLMGENYVGDESIGKSCHDKVKKFEFAFEKGGKSPFRHDLYQSFTNLKIGRNVNVIFKKSN